MIVPPVLVGAVLSVALMFPPYAAAEGSKTMLTGLNLAGAEFGEIGGVYGKDYDYPTANEIADVAHRGFSVIRVPFLWERLQPKLADALAAEELTRLDTVVEAARAKHLAVILDLHNYARWNGEPIGTKTVPISAFADVWTRLAKRFGGRDGVIFGLMNEPHDMRTEDWADAAQAALNALRATNACNRVLVPGNGWTGAHSWTAGDYGTPNGIAMGKVTDPIGRMTFEFHQYLDADWSGRARTCRKPEEIVAALSGATDWLHQTKHTGFLAEVGAAADPVCLAGLRAMLSHLESNRTVWRGWTAWAAGAWWPTDYPLLLRAEHGHDTPQLALFTEHARRAQPDLDFANAGCAR